MRFKKLGISVLSVLFAFISTIQPISSEESKPEPYSNHIFQNTDLRKYNFANDYDLVTKFDYSLETKWPSKNKLPKNFDPLEFMEWAKNPGLGLKELHSYGLTGKGVSIAYVDQNISKKAHPELEEIDLHYFENVFRNYVKGNVEASMHGPAVLSLMAGKDIGVAPEATIYFEANPAWLRDQRSHADCIRDLIKINNELPVDKKFKVIGFSDNIDSSESNSEDFQLAVEEAKKAGIYVLFCGGFKVVSAEPMSDRDNPNNYTPVLWKGEKVIYEENQLYIPTDRTYAASQKDYQKSAIGGLSWTTPYIIGLMAIGWQINPDLSVEQLLDMMVTSAYKFDGIQRGGLINPKGYVRAVTATLDPTQLDYTLFIYNSLRVNDSDWISIKNYANDMPLNQTVRFLDVKDLNSGIMVYEKIKDIVQNSKGKLCGIQIFGTANDVPAFDVNYRAIMINDIIDEGGMYKTDYFYGNVDNSSNDLRNFSIYEAFKQNKPIDFIQDWPVVRLPLTIGDYSNYFNKYHDYTQKVQTMENIPLVNFSSPIFAQKVHIDDMSYFINNRIIKEFKLRKAEQVRLYGNQKGDYPVTTKVLGDVSTENLSLENKNGIADFLINSHGQWNNIDKVYFDKGAEKRESLINVDNINKVLSDNYYNLYAWTCNNGWNMEEGNLTYTALADGKAMNVFSSTHVLSNNGVNVKANLTKMKDNNFYYFYYSFMKYYYNGYSRANSFWLAKKDYVTEILNHTDKITGEGNYQFNLNNVLIYHHFGLLNCNEKPMKNK